MKDRLVRIFYGLFSVCFALVVLSVIFRSSVTKPLWFILGAAACLIAFALIYRLIGKYENVLDRHYSKILITFALVMFIVEVIAGIMLRFTPAWDIGAIHNGAAEWVETGTFEGYYKYFYGCPNNIGPMAFLYVFFKAASLFGITDYYVVSVVITSIMCVLSMVLVSLICRRLADIKIAVLALAVLAVSAQYWFLGGAVYTDTMSMMFPVLIFWLYLKSKEQTGKRKICTYFLMGISAAVGSLNKFTVIIMVIAVTIDMCFNYKPKEILKAAACIVGTIVVIMVSFNGYMYSKHLNDRDMKEAGHRPYTHWVMMGLRGDGRYNPEDFSFTDTTPPEERTERVNEEVIRRIREHGVSGIFSLLVKKSAIDFGDGTYGSADFYWLPPHNETKLHDWVLEDGKNYKKYSSYVSMVQLSLMLLMLFGAIMFVFNKNENRNKLFPLYLAVFGVWIFLMCWETHRRYFVNFAPVIITCGIIGMNNVMNVLNNKMIKKR